MRTLAKFIFAQVAVVFLMTSASNAQELKKITMSYTAHSNLHMPFFIAQKKGYFREEGLELEMALMKGEIAVKAAATDSIDYTAGAGGALPAILRGLKMRIIMVMADRPADIDVIVQPKVNSFADLKGGTFATSGFGDFTDVLTRAVLKRNGIDPDKDLTMLTLGTSGDRLAALKGGAVTSATLAAPHNYIALQQGLKKLASLGDYIRLVYGGIAVSENKLRNDPDQIRRVLRATLKGLIFYRTKKDETVSLIAETFKVAPKTAEQMWASTLGGLTEDGAISGQTMNELITPVQQSINPSVHTPPAAVFDMNLFEKVDAELKKSRWRA
jgi:NitT/TauT family transport system substrate-binding protein